MHLLFYMLKASNIGLHARFVISLRFPVNTVNGRELWKGLYVQNVHRSAHFVFAIFLPVAEEFYSLDFSSKLLKQIIFCMDIINMFQSVERTVEQASVTLLF